MENIKMIVPRLYKKEHSMKSMLATTRTKLYWGEATETKPRNGNNFVVECISFLLSLANKCVKQNMLIILHSIVLFIVLSVGEYVDHRGVRLYSQLLAVRYYLCSVMIRHSLSFHCVSLQFTINMMFVSFCFLRRATATCMLVLVGGLLTKYRLIRTSYDTSTIKQQYQIKLEGKNIF